MSATSTQTEPDRASRGSADQSAAVSACDLSLQLDDRAILKNISLNIPRGQTVALLGANGAGKSTLMRVLATLTPRSGGMLKLFGQEVKPNSIEARSRLGLIAHQPMLYGDLSAMENLVFFAQLYDVDNPRSRAREMLELVGLLNRGDDAVKKLSRGMTQRVAIARALIHDPDLVLADEPFDGLDAASAKALEAFLNYLHQRGKTVILANHDIAQSLRLADAVILLRRGQVALEGPADTFTAETILQNMVAPS